MVRDQSEHNALALDSILQDHIIGGDAIRGNKQECGITGLVDFSHFALRVAGVSA